MSLAHQYQTVVGTAHAPLVAYGGPTRLFACTQW
jgi:hypothetical protein